jgi:hypothetical protein
MVIAHVADATTTSDTPKHILLYLDQPTPLLSDAVEDEPAAVDKHPSVPAWPNL